MMIFVVKYVSRMVFEGSILGSASKIWGNPYSNNMTILFDKYEPDIICLTCMQPLKTPGPLETLCLEKILSKCKKEDEVNLH